MVKVTAVLEIIAALGVLLSARAFAAELTFGQSESLPPEVHQVFSKKGLGEKFASSSQLNPFYIQGDFNGDGRLLSVSMVSAR